MTPTMKKVLDEYTAMKLSIIEFTSVIENFTKDSSGATKQLFTVLIESDKFKTMKAHGYKELNAELIT